MSDIFMRILLSAQDNASSVIKGLGSSISGGAAGSILGALSIAGVAAVGFGVASTKMAADYQQALLKVQALTGSTNTQMAQYDTSLKALAIDAGVAPTKLADGLYNVISAGYSGADAMKVLTLATEDSKIGMTSAAVTSDALTNVMASFNAKVSDATRINGEMLQTVTLGKSTFEQYASTIVKSASASAQYGISMETMNAAFATLTSSGIKAAQASTDYQQSLKVMYGNIGTVTTSLQKNGIAFDEAKFNTMSYGDKIQYLNTAIQTANDKHVKITGVTLQAAQAISTIAGHIKTYNSDLATLSDKQAMSQKTQQAWSTTQEGFNQKMSQAGAAVQVLMINIGSKLLPILTQLLGAVTPMITKFTQWITTGDRLKEFLDSSSPKMIALKIVLIALAGVVGGLMVAAFISFAVAAWAAVVPLLPFIAIGALVALVIAGIVMAVMHWGQIVDWLKGVWGRFTGWLGGVFAGIGGLFSALGTFVHGVLINIAGFFTSVWNGIVSGLRAAWNFIVSAVKIGAALVLLSILGPFIAIGALFVWLYNHNYYFKALIDAIVNIVKAGLAWLQSAWVAATAFLGALWSGMVGIASSVWSSVSGAIRGAVQAVWGWLQSVWSTAVSWISTQWGRLSGLAGQAWAAVTGVFQSAWGGISGALSSLWSNISGWFSDLAGSALTWGQNVIQNIINGIGNMLGALGDSAASAAQTVANFLGFHSPTKEGPGSKANTWGPALVEMFAKDLTANTPKARAAAEKMIGDVAKQLQTFPKLIAAADLAGNANRVKALEAQRKQDEDVMRKYKDLITLHGYKYQTGNLNDLINFNPSKAVKQTITAASGSASGSDLTAIQAQLQQIIVILGAGLGVSTVGGVGSIPFYLEHPQASATGRGGITPQPGIVHNHYYHIHTMARSQSEVRRLVDMIEAEQGHQFRIQTSGYSSGGIF